MIKTAMIILMVMGFASSAQAESVLMKMPYGIEFGKQLSEKIKGRSSAKKWESDENKISYSLQGKFNLNTNKGLVYNIYFGNDEDGDRYSLPKSWRRLGLKICTPDVSGTSYQGVRAIIQREEAKYIEERRPYNMFYDTLEFEIGGKYLYKLFFLERMKDNENQKECKGGLMVIKIYGNALDEDY